jgi:hypothetical protein
MGIVLFLRMLDDVVFRASKKAAAEAKVATEQRLIDEEAAAAAFRASKFVFCVLSQTAHRHVRSRVCL